MSFQELGNKWALTARDVVREPMAARRSQMPCGCSRVMHAGFQMYVLLRNKPWTKTSLLRI